MIDEYSRKHAENDYAKRLFNLEKQFGLSKKCKYGYIFIKADDNYIDTKLEIIDGGFGNIPIFIKRDGKVVGKSFIVFGVTNDEKDIKTEQLQQLSKKFGFTKIYYVPLIDTVYNFVGTNYFDTEEIYVFDKPSGCSEACIRLKMGEIF